MSKKLKIRAFIRSAIYNDVFDKQSIDLFKKDQEVFYKEKDNTIRGPYRIAEAGFFPAEAYNNILALLKENRIYVVDGTRYKESVMVSLPLVQPLLTDLLAYNHTNGLTEHTVFYIIKKAKVSGPFVVTPNTQMLDVSKYIELEQFFVLDKISNLKEIETITTAAAV
ncbi:MAG: hypothetical protein ACSHXA_07425 [Polaribacter sp.]|uniref:hypothetical protein n=1 Tax=Polaribacter sp. TaxID=1920175 RepID=UPI003EF7DBB0